MTRVVIGSTAARGWFFDWREPKDLDVFSDNPRPGDDAIWYPEFNEWWGGYGNTYASLNELYTIKVSHSYWDLRNGSWAKHMSDVVALQERGAVVIQRLHDLLYGCWEKSHGKKVISLDQDAGEFFSDAVTRVYEHDSIHDSVAYHDEPMYTKFLKPGATVNMDMRKVWAAPWQDQINLFREEVYATALERWLIPHDYEYSPRKAYAQALRKTITNLTKGKSAQFLVENYATMRKYEEYVPRHMKKRDRLIKL